MVVTKWYGLHRRCCAPGISAACGAGDKSNRRTGFELVLETCGVQNGWFGKGDHRLTTVRTPANEVKKFLESSRAGETGALVRQDGWLLLAVARILHWSALGAKVERPKVKSELARGSVVQAKVEKEQHKAR